MTTMRPDRPLPAPLPYRSAAARGDVPTRHADAQSAEPDQRAPLLREDEVTFWLCAGIVAWFVLLMVALAWIGARTW